MKQLRTVREAAEQLGLASVTIRVWLAQRKMGFVKLGRAVRIPQSEIDRLINHGMVPPTNKAA